MNTASNYANIFFSSEESDPETVKGIVKDYPASSLAQFMSLYYQKKTQEPQFENSLKQIAIYLTNPFWIQYQLLQTDETTIEEPSGRNTNEFEISVNEAIKENIASVVEETQTYPTDETRVNSEELIPVAEDVVNTPESEELISSEETKSISTESEERIEEKDTNSIAAEMDESTSNEEVNLEPPLETESVPPTEENRIEENNNREESINLVSLAESADETRIEPAQTENQENNISTEEPTEATINNFEYVSEELKMEIQEATLNQEKEGIELKGEMKEEIQVSAQFEPEKEDETETESEKEKLEGELSFEPLHTVDYFASQGIKISDEVLENDQLGKQVKSFTAWLKSMKKLHPGQLPEQNEVIEKIIQSSAEASNQEANILTEAMAEVLVKQDKKEKAIEMYQKLSLLNPSKSSYFAAKIESLKTT